MGVHAISSSIHFRSRDAVMRAYENKNTQAWALWQSKQFLAKGIEGESLSAFLEALEESESTAVYTLMVFEGISDVSSIKANTQYDGSFNFRLSEPEGGRYERHTGRGGYESTTSRELREMREMILEMKEKMEGEPDVSAASIESVITGYLDNPDKLMKVVQAGRVLLGFPAQPQPLSIGNVRQITSDPAQQSLSPSAPSQQEYEALLTRLSNAITKLETADPLIVPHLEKLAELSVKEPARFKSLISMLDLF